MADAKTEKQKVQEITEKLEQNQKLEESPANREVPEFTKELMAEHTKEHASVIDETEEIAQEHANNEPDRENEVFLVNYNEWREVSTLDFEQNYFAIDDPYADGDFRLLHLQNQIKDITPAGVHYDTYEEAEAALYEAEREMANMPFNKENNIGSYMVNGKAQLERIMEARQLQKHMDIENDKVSYYVIADLSTWAENNPKRSKLERFDSILDAMEAFQAYRGKDAQYSDDKARTTFGVSVHGIEFDVIHVRNNENVLSLDFTHSSEAKESKHFMDDLQTLSDSIGIDKVRVHRDMTPEEVKEFVKQRFEHQLKQGGLDDISLYMSRFDTIYEQGKMEKLMPTASQKHIEEDVPIAEWDNPYFEVKEPEQKSIFSVRMCEEERHFINTSGLDAEGLCKAYGTCEKPFVEMGKYGQLIEALDFVAIQQSGRLAFSVEFDADRDEIVISDGDSFEHKVLSETVPDEQKDKNVEVTLTVAECGEFHSLGELHENITSVEEAIAVWKSIPLERMNGIPSIGINIHTEGTERYEDVEMDILSGKVIDLEILDYVPDITGNPKAIEVIAELIDKLPDIEVRGSLEKWQAAILASEIDQFSYDYDAYQYQDTIEDRKAQVSNITEDIRNGNTGYLNDFLNAVISESVREGITDIFEQGVEIDDSEAVQTARRAKELLDKLAEYKPLAKIEELEEQNYNMIDNVLNNGAEKKEQEHTRGRISIREKLAEKKEVIEQRDKSERTSPEKETEKKSQREM